MTRFWKSLTIVFVVAAPLWYGPIIYHDLTHPEIWGVRTHDPRLYGPVLLAILLTLFCIVFTAFRQERRWNAMTPQQRAEEAEKNLRRYIRR